MPADETPESTRHLALRVTTMPRDTNQYGTIFGGVILSWIDQAGFVQARRHAEMRWVTASLDRVDFQAPVHVGDVVSFFTRTLGAGRTSLQIGVEVDAGRFGTTKDVRVTTARMTVVAVDEHGRPTPFQDQAP